MTGPSKLSRAALLTLSSGFIGVAAPAAAQPPESVSRAVVQPLPPAAADDLNGALLRLAKDRRDVDALITAGLASLELDDIEAAIGFFGRAKELSPQNARIAEGMGAAYVRSGRPVEALKFFDEAEQAGINTGSLWADRGLAYDLVGQNAAAQTAYDRALSLKDDVSVRQRLALSQAIGGDREAFEQTLKPLLETRDFGAYRTRAFGLAMLGEADEAIEIARAVMPRDLAGRMEPYLRFMPRLTRSQQAAAANLGIYPSASRIGRDDPRIASAAGALDAPAIAVQPQGEAPRSTALAQAPRQVPDVRDPLKRTIMREPSQGASAPDPGLAPVPAPTSQAPSQPAASSRSASGELPATGAQEETTAVRVAQASPQQAQRPAAAPPSPPAPAQATQLAAVNLGQPESRSREPVEVVEASPAQTVTAGATNAAAQPASEAPRQMGLADAFAEFAEPTTVAVSGKDVVDISAIEPVREEAKPEPPPAPRRIWLQLGIGQNRNLLRNDWRLRYSKFDVLKDKGPFVTPWGQTNRLLAGPFDSQADARAALNVLTAENVDAFVWTSPQGQDVEDLR
ncbi:tetratricopeptide repeat protein [Alteriqipengyuania sp. 357]